jgi:biopolymer transport protein ExbD
MQFEGYRRRAPSINLSALVDVLFILIVFVMLAANFDRIGALDVDVPSAEGAQRPDDRAVRLVVPKDGPMRLEDQPVEIGELGQRLSEVRRGRAALILIADGGVPLARATAILGHATAAGYTSVAIAARPASRGVEK